jgi:HSP20 family protein
MPGTLTRWDPFAELSDLRTRFDRIFGDDAPGQRRAWAPAVDVIRDDGNLVLRADIPGMEPSEVKIQVEDDVLTVSGEHEERTEAKEENYVRRERRVGSFMRSMPLPRGVDPSKIKAQTRHGVLEVVIPLPAEPEKKTVEITPTAG